MLLVNRYVMSSTRQTISMSCQCLANTSWTFGKCIDINDVNVRGPVLTRRTLAGTKSGTGGLQMLDMTL